MRVGVSGSSGMVGSALVPSLAAGHGVVRLVRREARGPREVRCELASRRADAAGLEGVDAVVHLAGHGIAQGRWTVGEKRRILDSRVEGTHFLCRTLAGLERRPAVLVCASGIGYYGDRGAEVLTEASSPGGGFLAEVCRGWEAACDPAREVGIRVVNLRFGMILHASKGALARMLPPFRLGLGGPIGSGAQHWSWIAIEDVVGVIEHALASEELEGPVNAVAPAAPTNREFTRTLGDVLRRPTVLPMPRFAARLALGEMADQLLLASANVDPAKLRGSGYAFRHPDLEGALRHLLSKTA